MIRSFVAIAFMFYASSALAQWVPPVGIPAPPIDVLMPNPARTTPVSVLPASVAAGQVVTLAGTVPGRSVACSGTAERPAWILGPAKTTGEFNVSGQYCYVDGITGYQFHLSGHHHMVRNSEFVGVKTDRQMTGVGGSGQDLVVYNNKVHDFGDINAKDDQDAHGIGFSRGARRVWVLENESYRNSGDGVNCNPYPYDAEGQTAIALIYIGRNKLHDNKQTGQWCKQSTDIIVSENEIYGHHAGNSSYGQGAGFQYDTHRIWYLKNNVHDNDVCFGISEGSEKPNNTIAFYIGNTCTNARGLSCSPDPTDPLWSCAGFYLTGSGASFLQNNTLTNVVDGVHAFRGSALSVVGTVGNTHVNTNMPTMPARDLAADFMTAYRLDISSLTGAAPPPPVVTPPPPQPPPVITPTPPVEPPPPPKPPAKPSCHEKYPNWPRLAYVVGVCSWP